MHRFLSIAVAATIALDPLASRASLPTRTIVRTAEVASDSSIRLSGLRNGAVHVIGVRDRRLSVRAALVGNDASVQALDVTISTVGTQTTINLQNWPRHGGLVADIELRVPRDDGVDVSTENGSIALVGMTAAVKVETQNGAILVRGGANVDAISGNGTITIEGTGAITASTGVGDVVIDGASGSTSVRTGAGHISIVCSQAWRDSPMSATTGAGGIDVYLRGGARPLVRAASKAGIVDVAAVEQGSGPTITLSSGAGDIFVNQLTAP